MEQEPQNTQYQPVTTSQPESSPPPTPPENKKNSKKSLIITLLISLVVLVLAAGAYAWYIAKDSKVSEETTTTPVMQKPEIKKTTKVFTDETLAIHLNYPIAWGEPTLKEGAFVEGAASSGSYMQLKFSKQPLVDINFVQSGYRSLLDGCVDPLLAARSNLAGIRASVIGWEGDNIKVFGKESQSSDVNKEYIYPRVPSEDVPNVYSEKGWNKVAVEDAVLIYDEINKNPYNIDTVCKPTPPQSTIDAANAYARMTRFALNFKSNNVVGVNAQYDSSDEVEQKIIDQTVALLNSIPKNR